MAPETERPDTAPITFRDTLPALRLQITTDTIDLYDDMSPKTTAPPALPTRSALRASRILTTPLKGDAADPPLSPAAPPHEVYLSSEEDGSSSADDFSEYDFESETEEGKTAGRKRSCEDVAKAVPVVFSGKPTVVTVKNAPRVRRQATMPDFRASSIPDVRRQSTFPLPPRSASLADPDAPQHAFLGTDPFAEKGPEEDGRRGSMLRKTIGLVRKRSRPFLMTMANSSVGNLSSASLASASPTVSEGEASPRSRRPSVPSIKTNNTSANANSKSSEGANSPVTYNDILRNVKRNEASRPRSPAPASPASPAPASAISGDRKSRLLGGLTMGKRRSVRA